MHVSSTDLYLLQLQIPLQLVPICAGGATLCLSLNVECCHLSQVVLHEATLSIFLQMKKVKKLRFIGPFRKMIIDLDSC